MGDSIASTLDNLISPSGSGGSKQLMAASWFRTKSRYYSHRRPSSIRYLDFMLVLDSSGSIGAEDFKEGKEATEVRGNSHTYRKMFPIHCKKYP